MGEEELREAAALAAASRAANTRRTYASAWKDFSTWCATRGAPLLPARPLTLVLYLRHLDQLQLAVSTIAHRLAAIAWYHTQARTPHAIDDPAVAEVWAGLRRLRSAPPAQKAPLRLAELRDALPPGGTLVARRDRALLLLGWAGAFRRSELAALEMADLARVAPDRLVIELRRSKSDQEGTRRLSKVILAGDHTETCPLRALDAWLAAAGIRSGAVFRAITPRGRILEPAINDRTVARIVKRAALVAGLDPRQLAGHSLRAGFVTEAYARDVPEVEIMEQSGHADVRTARRYRRASALLERDITRRVGL